MDFEGLFSGDMGELSNMDVASQINPIEEDTTDQSQWQNQDDLNLDDNTTTGGLSEETRTKLEECQNELDRLNNEKANIDAQLAQMNNPVLRVNIISIICKEKINFLLESFFNKKKYHSIRNRTCTIGGSIIFRFISISLFFSSMINYPICNNPNIILYFVHK